MDVIELLLQYTSKFFHLAIGSRTEPDLGLSRLRVKHQLNEILAGELSFTRDEALQFYNDVMGIELDIETVTAIESHTEGWIAACQLTALSLTRNTDKSSVVSCLSAGKKMVADYLVEEVLKSLSPQTRDFLLATSILKRQCDALCAYLLEEDEPKVSLRMLEKMNLFVHPLDDHGCWYRYHPLFAEFLRNRLAKIAPEYVVELHSAASKWFADHQLIHEAVDHIIAAKDQSALIGYIETHFFTILFAGDLGTVRSWLNAVDRSLFKESPLLILAEALWNLLANSDNDVVDRSAEFAQAALEAKGDDIPLMTRAFSEMFIHLLYASTAYRRGEFQMSIERAEFARATLPNELKGFETAFFHIVGSSWAMLGDFDRAGPMLDASEHLGLERGQYLIAFSSMVCKAGIAIKKLDLHESFRICTTGLQLAKEKGCRLLPVVGGLHVELGRYYFYRGDFTSAQKEFEEGIRRYGIMKLWDGTSIAHCYLARMRLRTNDIEGARLALSDAQRFAKVAGNKDIKALVSSHKAFLFLQLGDIASAQRCVRVLPLKDINSLLIREQINLIRFTIALYSGSDTKVLKDIQESIQVASQRQLFLHSIQLRILMAMILARLDRNEEASLELEKATEQAMPEGIAFYFMQSNPEQKWSETIRQLSSRIQKNRIREYIEYFIDDTLEDMAFSSKSLATSTLHSGGCDIETLTERELEVLELISKGLSNGDITKQLYVSMNTVKTHVKHIMQKLKVKNRTEAVHEARSRCLLNRF